MVKYYLKNGQEVKIGNTVEIQKTVDTTLGKGTATVSVLVTQASLELLIKEGFVVKKDDNEWTEEKLKRHLEMLKPYIRRFARKNKMTYDDAVCALAAILEMSPASHIQMLLEVMSEVMNREKPTSSYMFVMSPLHGFNIYKTKYVRNKWIPRFYSEEDAKKAYMLLKPFIDEIVNGE